VRVFRGSRFISRVIFSLWLGRIIFNLDLPLILLLILMLR
jgi:hypothetical protein